MNKDLEDRYLSVIEDNVNVGKTSDLKEFGILVSGIVGLCVAIYFCAGLVANVWIDRMSNETQLKIESALALVSSHLKTEDVVNDKIKYLETVKPKIVAMDKKLQGKSKFPIYVDKNSEVNAYITPNGTIYFTSGMLKEVDDNEALTFVLAHELAHYAHRDHLKGIGRELIAGVVLFAITAGQADLSKLTSHIAVLNSNIYSQKQEKAADLYANNVVIKLFGSNDGAIKFFKLMQKKVDVAEFLYYFSTHPAPSDRIKLLQNAK